MLTKFNYNNGDIFEFETYCTSIEETDIFENIETTPPKSKRLYTHTDKGKIYKNIKNKEQFKLEVFLKDIEQFNLLCRVNYKADNKTIKSIYIYKLTNSYDDADTALLHLFYFYNIVNYKYAGYEERDSLWHNDHLLNIHNLAIDAA